MPWRLSPWHPVRKTNRQLSTVVLQSISVAQWQPAPQKPTTANLDDIFVTALDKNNANFFTDEQFAKDVDNFFKSTTSYYWPNDDSELKFFAYAPSSSDLGGTVTITNATKTLADFSPKTTIADQKDFVSCQATGKKSVNESAGVALTFKHQLSQIEIKAKNDQDAYRYKVVAVRIGQPVSKGTFDFGTESWNLETDKVNYTVPDFGEITLNGTPESLMGMGGSAMLIPQQLTAWDAAGDKPNGGLWCLPGRKTPDNHQSRCPCLSG